MQKKQQQPWLVPWANKAPISCCEMVPWIHPYLPLQTRHTSLVPLPATSKTSLLSNPMRTRILEPHQKHHFSATQCVHASLSHIKNITSQQPNAYTHPWATSKTSLLSNPMRTRILEPHQKHHFSATQCVHASLSHIKNITSQQPNAYTHPWASEDYGSSLALSSPDIYK